MGEQRLELLMAQLCHVVVAAQIGSDKAPPVSDFLTDYWKARDGEGGDG